MNRSSFFFAGLLAGCLSLTSLRAQPVVVNSLYSWPTNTTASGRYPVSLSYGADGGFYGVTFAGGQNNSGLIFRVNADGSGYTLLHSFNSNDGGGSAFNPGIVRNLTLVQGRDHLLYGTASGIDSSNLGLVFRLNPDGSGYTVLHTCANADNTPLSLVQGQDGALYVGCLGALGYVSIFKLNTDGTGFTTLHSGNEGIWPYGLIQGGDGVLYGTTYATDAAGGTVFKCSTNGNFTLLHTFAGGPNDGGYAVAAPLLASDGALYGAAYSGGTSNFGIIYKLNTDGSGYQVLHHFLGAAAQDGQGPMGSMVQGPGNWLYGTTANAGGTIYKIARDGTGYQVVYNFPRTTPGPVSGLIAGPVAGGVGTFYGTAETGGGGYGSLFNMWLNPPASITPLAGQTAGGQMALFWPSWAGGYTLQMKTNLTSTNWVTVSNGLPLLGVQVTNNLPASYYRLVWP